MTNATGPDVYQRLTAVDQQGDKIGSVGQVYLNDQTGQPDWVTVNTGLFGTAGELRAAGRFPLRR